jgi:hypothetical protein
MRHRRRYRLAGRSRRGSPREPCSAFATWFRCHRMARSAASGWPSVSASTIAVLLDELSLGLAPLIVERLLPVVREYAWRRDAECCSWSSTSSSR